jgi:hypothetical protein
VDTGIKYINIQRRNTYFGHPFAQGTILCIVLFDINVEKIQIGDEGYEYEYNCMGFLQIL